MSCEITEKAAAVQEATEALKGAEMRYGAASRDKTECVNRLNKAQREFDAVVKALKATAPYDTDWKRDRGHPVAS